jgi:hypothetical protein
MSITNPVLTSVSQNMGIGGNFITGNAQSLTLSGSISADATGGKLGIWLSGGSLTTAVFIGSVAIAKNAKSWSLQHDNIQAILKAAGQAFTDGVYTIAFSSGTAVTSPAIGSSHAITLDAIPPAVTTITEDIYTPGVITAPFAVYVDFNEAVSGVSAKSFAAVNASVTSVSLVTPQEYLLKITPNSGIAYGYISLKLQAGGAVDAVGHKAAAANLAGLFETQANTLVPVVRSLLATGSGISAGNGNLGNGHVVTLTATLNEPVTVTGTPILSLNDGGVAQYVKGSGSNTLVFSYTVTPNQTTTNLQVTGMSGGTITDSQGNTTSISGKTGGILHIDSTIPTGLSAIASGTGISNGNGVATSGELVTLTVTLNEAVTIKSGVPQLLLNDGGTASYVSGSGSKQLLFQYTVAAGQNTQDLQISSINTHGAKILDSKGNAVFSSDAVSSTGVVVVETTLAAPSVAFSANVGSTPSAISNNVLVTVTLAASAISWQYSSNGGGSWTVGGGDSFTLADGVYAAGSILVKQADAAGIVSASASPGAITIASVLPTVSGLSESQSGLTNIATQTITLSAAAEAVGANSISSVVIKDADNSSFSLATQLTAGVWRSRIGDLGDGSHQLYALVTDAAGNQFAAYGLAAVTVATQSPVVTAFASTNATGSETVTVIASAENVTGDSISGVAIYANGSFIANAVATGAGVWTYTGNAVSGLQYSAVVTDSAGNSVQAVAQTTQNSGGPSSASYNAYSGQLILSGANLDSNAADYVFSDLRLSGQHGVSYQLTGGAVDSSSSANQIVINLNGADQLALAALLNVNGAQALDASSYQLVASSGWNLSAAAINGLSLAVSNVTAPTISSVSFNAATSLLTVTGNHFAEQGGNGIVLSDLTLSAGNISHTVSGRLLGVSNSGFSVQLDSSAASLFTTNGLSTYDGNVYNLSASSGWDASLSQAISSQAINVSGNGIVLGGLINLSGINDTATLDPFRALSLSSANNAVYTDSASISFTAANGSLSGAGLSAGQVSNGVVSYTLATTTPAALQSELQNLQFTPTPLQSAAGTAVTTTFNLTVNSSATAPEQILQPAVPLLVTLTTDNRGDVYIGDMSSSTVEVFNAQGTWLRTQSNGVFSPACMATDSQDDLFVVGQGNVVEELNAAGNLVKSLPLTLTNPSMLVIDSSGNLFVDGSGHIVDEFNAAGVLLRTLSLSFSQPTDMVVDNQGNLFVSLYNSMSNASWVEEYSASGNLLCTLTAGIAYPLSMATDSLGDVYIANGGNETVTEYNAAGVLVQTLKISGGAAAEQLITDSSGDLYVVTSQGLLEEFNAAGGLLRILGSGLSYTSRLAIDSNGSVYAVTQGDAHVEKFSAAGLNASVTDSSTQIVVTSTANTLTAIASGSLSNPTLDSNPHAGDVINIADALSFASTSVSSANVIAAGGDATTLAGWVAGALSSAGADLAQHQIAWFNYAGNTWLVEQANAQGAAFGAGDTLVELVGSFNESSARLLGHGLVL